MSMVNKRFPANTSLNEETFLNDKKVNAELYAFLIAYSYPDEQKRTITRKADLPTQAQICDKIDIKSTTTYRTHLKYLIEKGYIEDDGEFFIFTKKDIYFDIPLDTVQYLNDTVKESVYKAYIYLGQRNKFKPGYIFTLQELAEHTGIKIKGHSREYTELRNILRCLEIHGLVKTQMIQQGTTYRMKIIDFSYHIKDQVDNF